MSEIEIFNSDLIDEQFFKIFKPIYYTQLVIGSSRINFKNKFISSTSIYQKMYRNIVMIATLVAAYVTGEDVPYKDYKHIVLFYVSLLHMTSTIYIYLAIIIRNTFFQCEENVEIYVVMQNIDRTLKLQSNRQNYDKLYHRNIAMCATTFLFYVTWALWYNIGYIKNNAMLNITSIFTFYILSVEDFELLSFTMFLEFLQHRIEYINMVLDSLLHENGKLGVTGENQFNNLLKAYSGISKAYNLLQLLFRYHIFSVICYTVVHLLVFIETIIVTDAEVTATIVGLFSFTFLKILSRPIFLAAVMQRFENKLNRAQESCLCLTENSDDRAIRRVSKNIRRLLKVRMRPFSVYGVFTINTRLPLRLLALTTTYTVVLLQFAFL